MPPGLAQPSSASPITPPSNSTTQTALSSPRVRCLVAHRVHRGPDVLHDGVAAQHPAEPPERVAAHVHQHAAAGLVDVPEPVAVRARVLLQLLQHVDVADRALAHQLPHALVLRREAQLLGVHQLPAVLAAHGNHLVGLLERHAQGLLDDHVLAGACGGERDAVVQEVGQADVHDVAVGLGDRAIEVGEPLRDAPVRRHARGALGRPRVDGGDLRVRHEALVGLEMDVGDEAGAEQGDFGFGHGLSVLRGALRCCRVLTVRRRSARTSVRASRVTGCTRSTRHCSVVNGPSVFMRSISGSRSGSMFTSRP